MLGRALLSKDEMMTCLCVAAATINERPLAGTTEDANDLIPLTPAMFLKGTKMTKFPEAEHITGTELQIRYKVMRKLQLDLQARFRKEYLGQLVQKASEKKTRDPKIGDIVLVGADNKKRFEWPLGRILKLNKGRDGQYRSALVKTAKGFLDRPLQRLYPLEVPCGNDLPKQNLDVPSQSDVPDVDEDPETVEVNDEELVKEALPEVVTRYGRHIKKPKCYSDWFKK
ncbi:uncharacterized protein LOC110858916 [Folsomia candida]|uniref:DUF5641 domain-containing protein n=1 Tax=Folsomia candida TaxID=158441 RepID=A0A226DCK7_FOLCA|nr:uncharacterized protein LOC110858916 [Folsomia candida]OXA43305.1 hypothetical protein Fcan01_22147 [Folsomia candida]